MVTLGVGMVMVLPSGLFIVRATLVPAFTAGMLTASDLLGWTTVDVVFDEEMGSCFVVDVIWTGAI